MFIPSGITPMTFYEQHKNEFTHARMTFVNSNIVFDDDDFESEGIEIRQYMNSTTDLTFGTASCVEVDIHLFRSSVTDTLTWSEEFLLEFGFDVSGGTIWFPIGYFTGSKPTRTQTNVIHFVAYDRMTKFDVLADDFIDSLDFQAENLLGGMTIYDLKDANHWGTWSGNVYKYSGMVFTPIIEDGIVTGINVNGDSGDYIPTMKMDYVNVDHTKKYYLFGCPQDTGNEYCFGSAVDALGDLIYGKHDKGYGTVVDGSQITTSNISYRIQAKGVVDNVVFRPHIQTSPLQDTSLLGIYKTLCAYIGIEIETGDEIAANMAHTFTKCPISKGCTCRDILAKIAEAAGCYAVITREGKVKMVWYADHTEDFSLKRDDIYAVDVAEVDWLYNASLRKKWIDLESEKWQDLENLTWQELEGYYSPTKVNAVKFVFSDEDVGITVPNNLSTANVYTIVNNPFLYGATTQETTGYLTNLYNRLQAFGVYVPVSTECIGNVFVEPGDIIKLEFEDSSVGRYPVFNRTIHYNGALTCVYETTGNLDREPVSNNTKIQMVAGGKIHILRNTVDELYSEINDPVTGLSTKFSQTDGEILQTAIATKAAVYYSNTQPTGTAQIPLAKNDLWIDTAHGNKLYSYTGSAWVDASYVDPDMTKVFYSSSAPTTGVRTGDMWIDTANNNEMKRYNGSTWDDASYDDPDKAKVFYSSSAPATGMRANDLWIDTDDNNKMYRYSGSAWEDASYDDTSKARIFVQNTAPTGSQADPLRDGDLWADTASDYKLYSYDLTNTQWVEASPDKYTIQSGVAITANGVEITGGKYVKIMSGGVFEVDSTNFKVQSQNNLMQTGDWRMTDDGFAGVWKDKFNSDRCISIRKEVNAQTMPADLDACTCGVFMYSMNSGSTSSPQLAENEQFWITLAYPNTLGVSQTIVRYRNGYFRFMIKKAPAYFWYDNGGITYQQYLISTVFYCQSIGYAQSGFVIETGFFKNMYIDTLEPYTTDDMSLNYPSTSTARGHCGTSTHKWAYIYGYYIYYNTLTQLSSRNVKHDIKALPSVGEKIDKLQPVNFVYNDDKEEKQRTGLVYEDVVEVMPEICSEEEGQKSINYIELIPMLLKEVQDLRKRVAELEAKVK